MSDRHKLEGGGEVRVGGHHGHRGEDGRHGHQARLQVAKLGPLVIDIWAKSIQVFQFTEAIGSFLTLCKGGRGGHSRVQKLML